MPNAAKKWELKILSSRLAGDDFVWLTLDAPPDWQSRPGQFVNIRCEEPGTNDPPVLTLDDRPGTPWPRTRGLEISELSPFVRRPVSICDLRTRPDGGREIVLLVRIVGPGSRLLSAKRPGDTLDCLGPIGNSFNLDAPGRRAWLVGGGCGIAPLVGLGRALVDRGREVTIFYGGRDSGKIPLSIPPGLGPTGDRAVPITGIPELGGAPLVIATEDGSLGIKGLVTDGLMAYAAQTGWDGVALFGCGPDRMMSAVATLVALHDLPSCQVSMENFMGCAIGVCLSCAAKVRAENEKGWVTKFVCQDGPIFEARDVIFEQKWEGCKP
jgi:dihydroorotate dehydrogenase electron transfer subunit